MTAPAPAHDDPVGAWQRRLEARGRWRADMRPILEAHAAELPHPEDVGEHHGFEGLRPNRPFPAEEFPTPAGWFWETSDEEPDEDLMERTLSDGFVTAHLPGAIVRNVDISPGAKRKTYDARVHTFPVNRPRQVRTVERTGVPADRLGALLVEDL